MRARMLLLVLVAAVTACSKPAPKIEDKPGHIDCDGDPRNGKETNAKTDRNNCGKCGATCLIDADCVDGTCKHACKGAYKDCDADESNGCETDVTSAPQHCGGCGKSCGEGGTCVSARCVNVVAEKADLGSASAITVAGNELFFVSESRGRVAKLDPAKGTVTAIASGERSPWTLAVHGGFVYWAARDPGGEGTAGVIRKAKTTGGAVSTVFHSTSHYPQSIAVDKSGIYWTEYNLGNVVRVGLEGGTATSLATGQSFPTGIAIADGSLFWTVRESDKAPGSGGVARRPISGGAVTMVVGKRKQPGDLAVSSAGIFFLEGTTLLRAPLSGGEAATVTTDMGPKSLAVDATQAWWLSGPAPMLKRTSIK